MSIFSGIMYNLKGFWMGIRSLRLLLLGMLRFAVVAVLTMALSGFILAKHTQILSLLWTQPESTWIVWLWYLTSWLLSLLLMGISAFMAYLLAQLLFAVFIMDLMARITEQQITGKPASAPPASFATQMAFLIGQEIPRNIFPILLTLIIMLLSWFTPLGPAFTVMGTMMAIIFLAWDNTDIIPARNLQPFSDRFKMLGRTLPFHLGFGLPFLIPVLNLLLLSFAPVGATLYHLDKAKKQIPPPPVPLSVE